MKLKIILFIIVGFSIASCKSKFEKTRTSSDPTLIYSEALKFYEQEEYVKAQTLFELAIPFYRGKAEAEELFFKYADTYYQLEEYILAGHYYDNFSKTFYNSDKREEASFLSAYSLYKMSPAYKLDQTYSDKAVDKFQQFVNTFPKSEKVEQCNYLIDEIRDKKEEKSFYNANLYYDLKQYKSAIRSFENLLNEYPNSKQDELIRFKLLDSNFLLAENSVFELKEKRYQDVIKSYESFISKYPSSKYTKKVKKMNKLSLKNIKELAIKAKENKKA